jgi:aryl-alcohol dehydrogenase-like predicted oxidoreductase
MNARTRGISNEEILESAASVANARACTPYEVLVSWVRARQVFPLPFGRCCDVML